MTPETLEALKGSIEKWRKIVEEGGVDQGTDNCPLCQSFHAIDCIGCPVNEATGNQGCNHTPYDAWLRCGNATYKADTPGKLAAARAELEFLRSLLPKEEVGR